MRISVVGSEEVELGAGWNYAHVLQPFLTGTIDNIAFATHIVNAYKLSYQQITNDFTQSAIDLSKIHLLEQNIDLMVEFFLSAFKINNNRRYVMQSN